MKQHRILRGFTIIELIVVIVVIGILATVVIVGYGSWRQNIATSNVKSDLTNLGTAMNSARNTNNGYPTSIPSSFSPSPDVNMSYQYGDASSYCVNASSKTVTSIKYYIKTGVISQGTCPDQHYDVVATNTGVAKTTCSSGTCLGRIVKLTLDPAGTSWSGTYYGSDSTYYYVTAQFSYSIIDTNNSAYNDSTTITLTPPTGSNVMVSTRYAAETLSGVRISVNPAAADSTNMYGGTFQNSLSIVLDQYNRNSSIGSSISVWFRIPKASAPATLTFPIVVNTSNMPYASMDGGYASSVTLKKV